MWEIKQIMAEPVLTGSSIMSVMGRYVARVGDMVTCPKCDGTFPIVEGDTIVRSEGHPVAFEGHHTACGAKLLSNIGGQLSAVISNASATPIGNSLASSGGSSAPNPAAQSTLREEFEQTQAHYRHNRDRIRELYNQDRETIINEYHVALKEMVDRGLRRDGLINAYINNIQGVDTWGGDIIKASGGKPYSRCWDQSLFVGRRIRALQLNLQWTVKLISNNAESHYWIAVMPQFYTEERVYIILLDPLYGTFKESGSTGGVTLNNDFNYGVRE